MCFTALKLAKTTRAAASVVNLQYMTEKKGIFLYKSHVQSNALITFTALFPSKTTTECDAQD